MSRSFAILFLLLLKLHSSKCTPPTFQRHLKDSSSQVRLSTESLNSLNSHWISQAFSGLLSALAHEKLRGKSTMLTRRHSICMKSASDLKSQTECLLTVMGAESRGRITGRRKRSIKHYKVVQRKTYKMSTYLDKNPVTAVFDKLLSTVQVFKGKTVKRRRWQRLLSRLTRNSMLKKRYTPPSTSISNEPSINRVLRDGVILLSKLTPNRNKTLNGNNIRFLSPRLFDITDESKRNNENNILSPSILPLHSRDRNYSAFASFLAEATGLADILEDTLTQAQAPYVNIGGEKVYLTKREMKKMYGKLGYAQVGHIEKLQETYNEKQLHDFRERGYTVMTPAQGRFMYGRFSPFADETALEATQRISERNVKRKLIKSIQHLSKYPSNFTRRVKDSVLSPVLLSLTLNKFTVFGSTVLSPVLLNPRILSPTIFGAVILSPWVLAPSILTPRVFAPVILSPRLLCPLVLSPHFFNPHVLAPGVLNPRILSPFFATPFILSPQVMSPAVLSPYALSPSVLNPRHMSPAILSPALLSPQVSSPMSSGFVLLSPAVLSPKFNSTPIDTPVIASPSILS